MLYNIIAQQKAMFWCAQFDNVRFSLLDFDICHPDCLRVNTEHRMTKISLAGSKLRRLLILQ